jgi:sensor c-di-GMP phosphodiesterase-like protein
MVHWSWDQRRRLAKSLRLSVTGEGIETAEQAALLRG